LKQFVLDYLERESGQPGFARSWQRESRDGDFVVELPNGRHVAIFVINRAIRVPEIAELVEKNTRRRIFTLFVLDGRMLPEDGGQVDPPPWMEMLHALGHSRLYAYWCSGRDCVIRPVHLDWQWGSDMREVLFGEPVQFASLRGEVSTYTAKYLTGRFAAAEFGEGAFWKKPNILEDTRYSYSWRNWSYAGRSRSQEHEQEATFDPWEEVERNYGDYAGSADYSQYRHQSREQRKAPKRAQSPLTRHYTTLGLSRTATLEEVKIAYRRKARENHPDLHPSEKDVYTIRMAEINAAFEAISKLHEA
jgi:hypothetical protein